MIAFTSAKQAAQDAYNQAGITPADLDVVEPYAPCTIVEVLVSEAIGLFKKGQGARAAFDGETRLGGRIPISTSGGLTSRGHPAYVTSLYNYIEMADQLRGRAGERQVKNAQLGLVSGELGNYNAALIHILEAMA
jgi:acetyl-CoA acetyltransferase